MTPGGLAGSTARYVLLPALSALLLCSADAHAQRRRVEWETPVVVTLLGPATVRVRVSSDRSLPCDTGNGRAFIDDRYGPGAVLRVTSVGQSCVCFQQTYAPLRDSDWSVPARLCSQCAYDYYRRYWVCPPNREPTIAIQVSSSRSR